jgi:hypothetical protein
MSSQELGQAHRQYNPRTSIQGRGAIKTVQAIAHLASCSALCARSRTAYLKKSMSRTKVETQNTHLQASEAVHPHRQHAYHLGVGPEASCRASQLFFLLAGDSLTFRGHVGRRGLDDGDTDRMVWSRWRIQR